VPVASVRNRQLGRRRLDEFIESKKVSMRSRPSYQQASFDPHFQAPSDIEYAHTHSAIMQSESSTHWSPGVWQK
jgi:hypothetical protein